MNKTLSCPIVRDLLPSYIDGLTDPETAKAVEEHLKKCPSCNAYLERMQEEEPEMLPVPEDSKELDYLKGIRRNNRKKIVLAVFCSLLLVFFAAAVKLFWIGFPADLTEMTPVRVSSTETGLLQVEAFTINSGNTVRLSMKREGDTVSVLAKEVLLNPFGNRSDTAVLQFSEKGVRRVECSGYTIWQDGLSVSPHTLRLYSCKTPYIGNNVEVGRLVSNLDLDAPCTLKLETAKEPYGLLLSFQEPIAPERTYLFRGNAYVLLALIDNLSTVTWTDPSGFSETLTKEAATVSLKQRTETYNARYNTSYPVYPDIKDYGKNTVSLELLRNILEI